MIENIPVISPEHRGSLDNIRHGEPVDYLEYGVLLPDGSYIWTWNPPSRFPIEFAKLHLPEAREAAQKAYEASLRSLGVTVALELRFVQRHQQIRYTDPQPLPLPEES